MAYKGFAQLPYGAVYFRKSNPPRKDFERDYAQAARDEMNTFRHWFMWNAIEVAPGVYEWDEWDMQLDLAAKYGIKTIIAECIHAAPEWAFAAYAHARFEDAQGRRVGSQMRNSSATGGFSGLCLDNRDFKALAGNFLTVLATRYKGHPGLGGYDVMNETNQFSSGFGRCFCPASQADFRRWLQGKYGDLKNLAEAWRRYSLTDWSQVHIPAGREPYPEYFDYADYHAQTSAEQFAWRVETLRAADPDAAMLAHGVGDASLHRRLDAADDAWAFSACLDGYGYTGGDGLERNPDSVRRWTRVIAPDLTRTGSRGKPIWACERSAGHVHEYADSRFSNEYNENNRWLDDLSVQDKTLFRHIRTGNDLRSNDLTALAAGTRGLLSSRWRGLVDGPLFDRYAYYNMDGSPTDRSEAAARMSHWGNAPEQAGLMASAPIRGDIALLNCPETQIYFHLLDGSSGPYIHAFRGAYNALLDLTVQPDIIKLEQLDDYGVAYLPCPMRLTRESADRLKAWVAAGGTLISEGCPGFADDMGHVDAVQPGLGLDALFGCRQASFYMGGRVLSAEKFSFAALGCERVYGGIYEQGYTLASARSLGRFANGHVAITENTFGKGRALLMGTSVGFGFYEHQTDEMRAFYRALLDRAGVLQACTCSERHLLVRLQNGPEGFSLWIVNNHDTPYEATIALQGAYAALSPVKAHWGDMPGEWRAGHLRVSVPAQDGIVLAMA